MVEETPESSDRAHYTPEFVSANWFPDSLTDTARRFYAVPVDLDKPGDLVLPDLQAGFIGYREPAEAIAEPVEAETEADRAPTPNRVSTMKAVRGLPQWAILMVVAGVVLLAVASSVQKLMTMDGVGGPHVVRASVAPRVRQAAPVREKLAAAAAPAEKPVEEKKSQPPPASVPREPEHPDAKLVQVTGLKVVQVEGRPQVQYLVVNRSAGPLADIGLHIDVRSASSRQADPPRFQVSARVPNLAAHQVKEIRTSLDGPVELGQDSAFRTDVRIMLER